MRMKDLLLKERVRLQERIAAIDLLLSTEEEAKSSAAAKPKVAVHRKRKTKGNGKPHTRRPKNSYGGKTALQVVYEVVEKTGKFGASFNIASEEARKVYGMNPRTCSARLSDLLRKGFISRHPDGQYMITSKPPVWD